METAITTIDFSSNRPMIASPHDRRLADRVFWIASCVLAAGALGCGGKVALHPVRGHVQAADGRRATFGTVEIMAEPGGEIASGAIQRDGSFQLSTVRDGDGAVAGRHRAIIVQVIDTEHLPLEKHHHVLDVHPRHGRYETSGLQVTVEPGKKNYVELIVDEAPRRPSKNRGQ